jgi:hypothetical protein
VSVKIIAELNPFHTQRTELTVTAKSIADIIEELDSGFPLSQARVQRNGEIVTNFSLAANNGDTLWIKFVPYGNTHDAGAGMKAGGWGLVALGIAALFIPGVGGFLGAALIGAGLSTALGGTVMMNIKVPSLSDKEKPEQDPSIRGGKNQMRQHGRIPVLFGRHRIYPDLAANPHTEIIDGKQYYTQLLCGGYKDYEIDLSSIRLGETPLVDLSQTKDINQILAKNDPLIQLEILQNGESSTLYPNCVHEEALNAVLENQVDNGNGEKISGAITRTTPDKTDTINVDIFFYNGLGKYNDDGDLKSTSVEVRASYKKDSDSAYQLLGYFNGNSNTISGSELKTKRFQITKSGLVSGQYTVKIERVTADSSDTKVIDQVYIGSIRSIKSVRDGVSVRPIRYERQKDLTIIALRVLATSQLNNVLDSLNYVATSKLQFFSENAGSGAASWLTSATTRNPAAMLRYALKGRAAQQIVDDDDIDYPALEKYYTWCNEHNYTCDAYLSESVTIAELLQMIGSTSRADILRIDSKISVVQDIERPTHRQLFTPKNTKSYSITMFSADVPDAIALRYIDSESGYAQNECTVYNTPDGNKIAEPETTQKVDLWGITNSEQTRRIGMYNYACLKHRPFVHIIEVDIEYLLCNKGDWIQYAGDIALAGSTQGRIKRITQDNEGRYTGFIADEPIEMDADKTYAVRIRTADGNVLLENIRTNPEAVNEVEFLTPLAKGTLPESGDLYAFGIRGMEVIDLIITDIQPGQDLSATLTCVEYSPVIFKVDEPDFVLPKFENKITPVSGAIDSGTVSQDNWKFFITYHDGEEDPGRPTGSGEDNGWHHTQTQQSVWQSSKMAESISSGTWNSSVRIITRNDLDHITNNPERPLAVENVKAIADRDYIHITWETVSTGLKDTIQKTKVEIKKLKDGDWELYKASPNEYIYQFDRTKDKYPEKTDLQNWRIRIKSLNIYGNESIEYGGGVSGVSIDVSQYRTWIPDVPNLEVSTNNRTISISAQSQNVYGYDGVEYQISKDGSIWFKPNIESSDYKTNESSWKLSQNGTYVAKNGQVALSLPLDGQTIGLPKNTTYYFRARGRTRKDDGTLLNTSNYSSSRTALAQANSVADIVENAIGSAQLQENAVTGPKIADKAIDMININSGIRPTRTVSALPPSPYTGYIQGDTVVLSTNNKLYRLSNVTLPNTSGWTSSVDGADILANSIAANSIATNSLTASQIASGAITADELATNSVIADKIQAGAIDATKIKANSVSAENLNVLAKNVVNDFTNGTTQGWTTNGIIVKDTEINLNVLEMTYDVMGSYFVSNTFEVLPDDKYEIKFGLQSPNYTSGSGIYLGLTVFKTFKVWSYNQTTKKWEGGALSTNAYFIHNFTSKIKIYFKTYILGSNIDINSVPPPEMTDTVYTVMCLQLVPIVPINNSCSIRSGFNATIAGIKLRFITPQVYKIGSGKIVANNIITNNLSAISANLGEVKGDANYILSLSDGMSNPKGTFLLGATTDAAYFRRWYQNGVWNMAIKLATFIVDSISSKVKGVFQVFRSTDNEAIAKPTFQVNPGTAAGSESTEVRGAFRVRKSTSTADGSDNVIFEARPNGTINSPNIFTARPLGTMPDFAESVILLGQTPVPGSSNIGFTPRWHISGDLLLYRASFHALNRVIFNAGAGYSWEFATSGSMEYNRSNNAKNCRLCTCIYNGEHYLCLYLYGTDQAFSFSFYGYVNNYDVVKNQFAVIEIYKRNSREVLNSEIWNSLRPLQDSNLTPKYFDNDVIANKKSVFNGTSEFKGEVIGSTSFGGPASFKNKIQIAEDLTISPQGTIAVGAKRCYLDRDELLFQEYQGDNMWKTIIAISIAAASLGLLSCEGVVTSDVIKSTASVFGASKINAIAYGNNKFVSVSSNGTVAYSSDGITWTKTINHPFGLNNIATVTFGINKFVASSTGQINEIAYSSDGITWIKCVYNPFGALGGAKGIVYGAGKFIGIGSNSGIAYSSDGVTWTTINENRPLDGRMTSISYGSGKFIVGGNGGRMEYSDNGITWSEIIIDPFSLTIDFICFGTDRFIAKEIGQKGIMAYSLDGVSWATISQPTTRLITAIAYGSNKFLIGFDDGNLYSSSDGIKWDIIPNNTLVTNPLKPITAITYGVDKFVVGAGGSDGNAPITAYLVNDNSLWTFRAGFLEKSVTASATKYKLFDGKWINLNSNGSVTWSNS